MKKALKISTVAAFLVVMCLGGVMSAPGKAGTENELSTVRAVECPVVLLKHWRASSDEEKLAFLFGLASMLELERGWQGTAPLPVSRSMAACWGRGLAGVTLGDMAGALDKYAVEHPDQLEEPVLKVLGQMYVSPSLTAAERREAGQRHRQIQGKP
ncbi:MAG: hypothetical protein LBH65_02235 [Desulfovibrio sp.]|jgi:hypothetical protein|nr:hypothetical protein [Desulfovibrio sp.]